MLMLDLKARFRNKAFVLSFVGAIVLLLQQLGLKQYIPQNWSDVLNTVLSILVMLGIVVDTSTPGISDRANLSNGQDSSKEFKIAFDDKDMTAKGNIEAANPDASSQMVVGDNSINQSVQANTVDIEALEEQKADIQSQIDTAKAQA